MTPTGRLRVQLDRPLRSDGAALGELRARGREARGMVDDDGDKSGPQRVAGVGFRGKPGRLGGALDSQSAPKRDPLSAPKDTVFAVLVFAIANSGLRSGHLTIRQGEVA